MVDKSAKIVILSGKLMVERERPTLESLENRQKILARLEWKRVQLWDQEKNTGLIGTGMVNVQTLEGAIRLGRMRLMNNEKLVQVREILGQIRQEIYTVRIPQLIEGARSYIGELALDEVRLEQIRKYVEIDKVLTPDVLQTHQARYDKKRLLANEDPDLKRGLGLLKEQKVAELLSQLVPQPVVDVELTQHGEIALDQSRVDQFKKTEQRRKGRESRVAHNRTLPDGHEIKIYGTMQTILYDILSEFGASEEHPYDNNRLTLEYEKRTGGNQQSFKNAILDLRATLKKYHWSIEQPVDLGQRNKGVKANYYFKKVEEQDIPVLGIDLTSLSTVVPSEDIEVITIEYQPRPDEIRTKDETIVLKVITESLKKSARLWVNLLADEIAALRIKDSLAGSEMGSYEVTADKLKYDFEVGYRKIINEAEVDELRLRWELKDEELWESIQNLKTTIIRVKDDSELIRRVKSALTMASNDWKEQHEGREFRRII